MPKQTFPNTQTCTQTQMRLPWRLREGAAFSCGEARVVWAVVVQSAQKNFRHLSSDKWDSNIVVSRSKRAAKKHAHRQHSVPQVGPQHTCFLPRSQEALMEKQTFSFFFHFFPFLCPFNRTSQPLSTAQNTEQGASR